MWQYDFHLNYLAGQAVWHGLSPNAVEGWISPYPFAILFATLAWMPEPVAYWVYVGGCALLLWKVMGLRSIWPLLSFPVWFTLFVGQVDLPLALLVSRLGVWGVPLLLAKPQVGFVAAPWYLGRTGWNRLILVAMLGVLFLALCFVLRPTWVSEWLAAAPTVAEYARRDSNLHWLVPPGFKTPAVIIGILVSLPLALLLKERRNALTVLHLFAPASNIYSTAVLAEWIGPLEVVLSWLAILLVGEIHSGAPMFVVGLSILIRYNWRNWRARLAARQTGLLWPSQDA